MNELGQIGKNLLADAQAMPTLRRLVRRLASGRPIERAELPELLRCGPDRLDWALSQLPYRADFDEDGRLVGALLTSAVTAHQVRFGSQVLYVWCALDALMLPHILQVPVQVTSPCAATGDAITFTATPGGVTHLHPYPAVVSLVAPTPEGEIRESFCIKVNFYTSSPAAKRAHPDIATVPVEQAFELANHLATQQPEPLNDQQEAMKTIERTREHAPRDRVAQHVVVIGSGSGGVAAAIKAADAGADVTVIEGGALIGGTCVNIGCVPSKILIRAAHLAHHQAHHPFDGLERHKPVIDRQALVRQQQARVEELRQAKYIDILAAHRRITIVRGWARFLDPKTIGVTGADGSESRIPADRVLVATGARPNIPQIPGLSDSPFWTSTEALIAEEVPDRLVVIGGSVVALELAQAFQRLGAQVTVLARSTLLSRDDPALGAGLQEVLETEGMVVRVNSVPTSVSWDGEAFVLDLPEGSIRSDKLLVAAGRRANTDRLELVLAGVDTDRSGRIPVDDHLRTNVAHIFAAGDCTDQPQYVYVAAAGGTRAAENMMGGDATLDLSTMPAVVFTDPAVATVGLTEHDAKARGFDAISRTLELSHVPRALANFETQGFVKLVADSATGRLLGAQILAPEAGEMIQTAVMALRAGMTVDELGGQLFPYLTMVEGLKLCAQTFSKDVASLSCCAG